MEVMCAGRRSTRGVQSLQCREERCEICSERAEIDGARRIDRLAFDPTINRPMPRIAGAGLAKGERNRHGKRQLWREPRQPSLFFLNLLGITLRTGQSNRHRVAETEGS